MKFYGFNTWRYGGADRYEFHVTPLFDICFQDKGNGPTGKTEQRTLNIALGWFFWIVDIEINL